MKYAGIIKNDVVNGIGVCVSVFTQGCPHHCKGCFQPQTWDFDYGDPFTAEIEAEIVEVLRPSWIQGLSILGGDPMEPENQEVLLPFVRRLRAEFPTKDIWLYTGYRLEDVSGSPMLPYVDVIVDGPFLIDQKDAGLAFRGSRNQRIIHLEKGVPV